MTGDRAQQLTLGDVARRAGVSPMTVSNVINGKAGVRPATRARVLEAIQATGYRVNLVARALAGGRNRVLSVFTPQLNRPYASEVVQGAAEAAGALGYDLVVMMLAAEGNTDLSMMTRLASGALLIQPADDGWRRPGLPPHVVSVDGPGEYPLGVDNHGGARQAMRHLLDLGHTRIAFISGLQGEDGPPADLPPHIGGRRNDAAERLRGYREALQEAGLRLPDAYLQHGDYSKASGERAARTVLTLPEPPSALFVSGDAMALGALHVAQDLGLRVPEDLSLVGFDDLPLAAASRPALTTVRQPLQRLGEVAVGLLVALAEGREVALPAPFATRLVVRESSGPPQTGP